MRPELPLPFSGIPASGKPARPVALILTFRSTHELLRSERALKRAKIDHDIIPVPVSVSSECGFCVIFTLPRPGTATEQDACLQFMQSLAPECPDLPDPEGCWSAFRYPTGDPALSKTLTDKEKYYVRIR